MREELIPPLWAAILMSAVFGLIAQLGSAKAFEMDKDKNKLAGSLILSFFFSALATTVCVRMAKLDVYLAIAFGTTLGTIPSLWTLGAGIRYIGKRYDIDIREMNKVGDPTKGQLTEILPPPPNAGES